jgi:hypothetical protein
MLWHSSIVKPPTYNAQSIIQLQPLFNHNGYFSSHGTSSYLGDISNPAGCEISLHEGQMYYISVDNILFDAT